MNKIIQLDRPTESSTPTKEVLAVYGSLKKGLALHGHITHLRFIKEAKTAPIYKLYDLGWYPGLKEDRQNGKAITVELYECDKYTRNRLDAVEGHPGLFIRSQIALEDGSTATAYLYNNNCDRCPDAGDNWKGPKHGR